MTAKAGNINSSFKAMAITDIPADQAYADVPAWKNDNNYTSKRQINTYPLVKLGDRTFHLSTQLAGVIGATDAANGDIPFVSPSNQAIQATASVFEDGTPLFLGPDQAAFLNGEGIVTPLNFVGGWKAWGNRTGAYPANTDPKDSFIPVRRMMDWIANTIILTYWQRIDSPINRRLTEAITDSLNIWLNGLTAIGALIGGRVEFLASENPETALMDGIVTFHVYATPPSPAREINFTVEYDAQYLGALFG
jgi:phage tail sheath protein FI